MALQLLLILAGGVAGQLGLRESLHRLGRDYAAYTAGTAVLETAERLTAEEREPSLRLFLLVVGALRALTGEDARDPSLVLDAFLLRAMSVAGSAPALADYQIVTRGAPLPRDGTLAVGGARHRRHMPRDQQIGGPRVVVLARRGRFIGERRCASHQSPDAEHVDTRPRELTAVRQPINVVINWAAGLTERQ